MEGPLFAAIYTELRRVIPGVTTESLIPDFMGDSILTNRTDTPPTVENRI